MINFRENKAFVLLAIVSLLLYFFFGYHLERTQFSKFLLLYSGLFASYIYLIKKNEFSFRTLLGLSILFRLVFLFSIPNLSQDFYRFIWDGRMLFEGLNPYLTLPETFINLNTSPVNQAAELYAGMGELNGSHYTNYPPMNQLCFYIAAIFGNKSILGSVIVMRILIILADIGIIWFGKKILEKMKLSAHSIFLYALNLSAISNCGNIAATLRPRSPNP